jgi:pyruvate, orthophosphate dikinase
MSSLPSRTANCGSPDPFGEADAARGASHRDRPRAGRADHAKKALQRIAGIDLTTLGQISLVAVEQPATAGIGASGGIAVGRAAFCSESAQRLAATGDPVILMRPDTSTADVAGFAVAAGIVTSVGARTAHAALVARQMGKPCVVGSASMTIDVAADRAQLAGKAISGRDWVTIDGDSSNIYLGRLETLVTQPEQELAEIASWQSHADNHDHRKSKPAHHRPRQRQREKKQAHQ